MVRAIADALVFFDLAFARWLAVRRQRVLTLLLAAATWSGATACWLTISGALFLATRAAVELVPEQLNVLRALRGVLLPLALGTMLKKWASRRRPFHVDHGIAAACWAPGPTASWPSTHAATSVAFATALHLLQHAWAWPVTVWASLVSLSRVYLGVHFVTDVLSGAVLGVATSLVLFD